MIIFRLMTQARLDKKTTKIVNLQNGIWTLKFVWLMDQGKTMCIQLTSTAHFIAAIRAVRVSITPRGVLTVTIKAPKV